MLSKVGVSVPGPSSDAGSNPDVRHADGLAGTRPASTGIRIPELATTTNATGVAKGALISTAASGGMSQAGSHGSAATVQAGR